MPHGSSSLAVDLANAAVSAGFGLDLGPGSDISKVIEAIDARLADRAERLLLLASQTPDPAELEREATRASIQAFSDNPDAVYEAKDKATVVLFKAGGKYYTEEEWTIPSRPECAVKPGYRGGDFIGPWVMQYSPDFRRIDNGAVLVVTQEPWGYPFLFPSPATRGALRPRSDYVFDRSLLAVVTRLHQLLPNITQGDWKLWGSSVLADPKGTGDVDDAVPVANIGQMVDGSLRVFNADFVATSQRAMPQLLAVADLAHAIREARYGPVDELQALLDRLEVALGPVED